MSFFLFFISVKDRLWQMGLPIGEEVSPALYTPYMKNLRKQKCLEMNQNQFLWTLAHILGHPNSTGALPDQEKAKKRQFLTQKRVWRAPF